MDTVIENNLKPSVTNNEDLTLAIRKARIAQKSWEKLSFRKRTEYLFKVRNHIVTNCDSIAETISKQNGKVRVDTLSGELLPVTMAISYFCKSGKKFLKSKKLRAGNIMLSNKRSFIRRIPYGVVGIISPWNYPFSIPMFDVITGLLAGNAILLKVATATKLVGVEIKKAFEAAGLPDHLFNLIDLPGNIVGDALLDNKIDKIFFTGSVEVGKELTKKAAESLTPVSLELGGNDAMIVCEDADINRAVSGALWGGFHNSGQSCGGVERIYVHDKIYDEFITELKKRVESLRVGVDKDFNVDVGLITTDKQKDSIIDHVEEALDGGAKLFASSPLNENQNSGTIHPAMILTDVDHNMKIMREETFGPVVCVMKFRTDDEAIELANDSNLGLTASIWTRDKSKAIKISRRIETGVVNINDHLMSHGMPETPWGGMKESGNSRTHGEFGFLEMTQPQLVVKDILYFLYKDLWWYPYNEKLYNALKGIMEVLYSKKISIRLKGFSNILKVIGRLFSKQ